MEKTELNRLIELSVIQQMYYLVKGKVIRDSRFNRIKNLSVWRISYLSFFSLCAILDIVIIFFPAALNRFQGWASFNGN